MDVGRLSQRDVAGQVGLSQSSVVRIERGQLDTWIVITDASGDHGKNLTGLLDAVHGETRPWSIVFDSSVPVQLQEEARERNAAAAVVRNFQPTVVPGLLQTVGYSRAALDLERSPDVAAALSARLDRQQVLHEQGRRFELVIGEQALQWPPGAGAWAGQAEHLLSLATLPNVELSVEAVTRGGVAQLRNPGASRRRPEVRDDGAGPRRAGGVVGAAPRRGGVRGRRREAGAPSR